MTEDIQTNYVEDETEYVVVTGVSSVSITPSPWA